MTDLDSLEVAILEGVTTRTSMNLEDLQQFFRHHSWNQLFGAVDQLSRKGSLAIRRIDRCTCLVSLGPKFATTATGSQPDNASAPVTVQSQF
jgi:hypothetical protein